MKKNAEINAEKNKHSSAQRISGKRFALYIVLALILIALDQISKLQVANSEVLQSGATIELIPGFFQLRYAFNTGAAFSMLSSKAWGIYLLTGISIVVSLVLGVLLYKYSAWPQIFPVAIMLVMAGSIGNLIDRIRLQGVIDFLDFYHNDWHFPTFNIADACISIGAIILIIYLLFYYEKQAEKFRS